MSGCRFKNFLLKDYEKLLTIDLICRGVISQKVYIDYLKSVERHTKSKITEVQFRNKDLGWNSSTTKISLEDGSFYRKERWLDEYMIGYLKHNLYLRPCCYECNFKEMPVFQIFHWVIIGDLTSIMMFLMTMVFR